MNLLGLADYLKMALERLEGTDAPSGKEESRPVPGT